MENPPLNARVQDLRVVDRQEHFDAEGGGRIVRIFYCAPYTSHKRVVTALKGTLSPNNDGSWARVLPAADPLYPWFYCTDVQVVPFSKESVTGSAGKNFDPAQIKDDNLTGQLPAIQTALANYDDFDGASFIDNLIASEVLAGAAEQSGAGDTLTVNTNERFSVGTYKSRGVVGAFVVATYNPMIFQPGAISGTQPVDAHDQILFDYVDPQWEPVSLKTQIGRSLFFYSPTFGLTGVVGPFLHGGILDTYEKPEEIWRFTIRRLMVPFIPKQTIALLANKLNGGDFYIGNVKFPRGTLRFDGAEVTQRRGPDGNIWCDLLLKFSIRALYDEYYEPITDTFTRGWIGWNWQYGTPTAGLPEFALAGLSGSIAMKQRSCYYPVAWNSGLFQTFGTNHPLFVVDTDPEIDWTQIANSAGIHNDMRALFETGFQQGQ